MPSISHSLGSWEDVQSQVGDQLTSNKNANLPKATQTYNNVDVDDYGYVWATFAFATRCFAGSAAQRRDACPVHGCFASDFKLTQQQ